MNTDQLIKDTTKDLEKLFKENYDKIIIEVLANEMRNLQSLLKQSQMTLKEEGSLK